MKSLFSFNVVPLTGMVSLCLKVRFSIHKVV